MKPRHIALLLLACSIGSSACTAPMLVETPARFVALEDAGRSHDYRATSADGVVIAARALQMDPDRGGDVRFWVDAITLRLRQMGGYALLDSTDLRTAQGLSGKQLTFGRDEGRRPYRYSVAVFLAEDQLLIFEAGGPQTEFEARAAEIAAAIRSLDPG